MVTSHRKANWRDYTESDESWQVIHQTISTVSMQKRFCRIRTQQIQTPRAFWHANNAALIDLMQSLCPEEDYSGFATSAAIATDYLRQTGLRELVDHVLFVESP